MKLSMQNLVDWFSEKGYLIHYDIKIMVPNLENVLWLSEDNREQEIVYVEPYAEFSDKICYTTIVSQDNDVIRISDQEPIEVFNELINIFEYYQQWERRLIECVLMKKPLQAMCDVGDEVFQAPTIICGLDGQTFAITRNYNSDISPIWKARLENDSISFDTIQKYNSKSYFKMLHSSTYPTINDSPIWNGITLNTNLYYKGRRKGFIVAYEYQHKFRPGDTHLMNIFARLIEQYLALNPNKYYSLSYLEHFLHNIIMNQTENWSKLETIFNYTGWTQFDCYSVLCVSPFVASSHSLDLKLLDHLQSMIANNTGHTCSFLYGSKLIILINKTIRSDTEKMIQILEKSSDSLLKISISLDFYDIQLFKEYFYQANLTSTYIRDKSKNIICTAQIISQEIKHHLKKNLWLKSFLDPGLLLLCKYDKENSTSLFVTLRIYYLSGCNCTDAAKILNLHRNTLTKRLAKISDITSLDITDNSIFESILYSLLLFDPSDLLDLK